MRAVGEIIPSISAHDRTSRAREHYLTFTLYRRCITPRTSCLHCGFCYALNRSYQRPPFKIDASMAEYKFAHWTIDRSTPVALAPSAGVGVGKDRPVVRWWAWPRRSSLVLHVVLS